MKNLSMGRGGNDFAGMLSSFLVLIAACAGGIGYFATAPAAYVAAGILVVFSLFVPRWLMIANQWERMVVLRLGRRDRPKHGGANFSAWKTGGGNGMAGDDRAERR
jgi:hypothetical protein